MTRRGSPRHKCARTHCLSSRVASSAGCGSGATRLLIVQQAHSRVGSRMCAVSAVRLDFVADCLGGRASTRDLQPTGGSHTMESERKSEPLITNQIGPYRVLSLLGAGGMGEVYRARDTRLGRDVAIKFLPAAVSADSGRRARLEREARLLATLNHPNIAH